MSRYMCVINIQLQSNHLCRLSLFEMTEAGNRKLLCSNVKAPLRTCRALSVHAFILLLMVMYYIVQSMQNYTHAHIHTEASKVLITK